MKFIGIDPGKSGCAAYINGSEVVYSPKFGDMTEQDTWLLFAEWEDTGACAVLEKVGPTPKMGRRAAFTFGYGFAVLHMALLASGIRYIEVTPSVWQGYLKCRTKKQGGVMAKSDKNVTKRKAQQLFPDLKVTNVNADALLLATYCRKNAADLF